MSARKRIVICGGGAIGAAIAYFTSRRGAGPIVIERHEVGGAASGKSGGFLALDWCAGTPLDALARRSFELQAELSSELGNSWGYRRLATYGGYAAEDESARGSAARPWLSNRVTLTSRLGSPDTTALVDPRAFTTGLMHAAEMHGAVLRHDAVAGLMRGPSGGVLGVALASGEIVEADAAVIAMGPWSIVAARWLPLPPVFGYKGHSLIFETGTRTPTEALFLEYREASGEILTPELMPRADGTTWICAVSSTGPVPLDPAEVAPDEGAHARLEVGVPQHLAGARRGASQGPAGVLSAGDRGRFSADRRRPWCRRCLRRDRSQRVGHAQRARHRRGDERIDPRQRSATRRCCAIRTRAPVAARIRPCARGFRHTRRVMRDYSPRVMIERAQATKTSLISFRTSASVRPLRAGTRNE